MKLLDFREDHVVEKEEEIKLAALEEGELLYDEWLKAEFYHNPVTGISKVRSIDELRTPLLSLL